MKTTDKDSNIKQNNEAVENEKLVKNPAEQQAVLEEGVDVRHEVTNKTASEQLDLAFADAMFFKFSLIYYITVKMFFCPRYVLYKYELEKIHQTCVQPYFR